MIRRFSTKVYAFVDWNTQIHDSRCIGDTPEKRASEVLEYVCKSIGRVLSKHGGDSRFDVNLRLYHGWRKGFEESINKKALSRVAPGVDLSLAACNPRILIRADISFGDNLFTALECRMHHNINAHLPDTFRKNLKERDTYQEKMVDTAMASDIVNVAHREHDAWLLVFGRDDDIVPAVFTAESVSTISQRQIIIVRSSAGRFLKLHGLIYK